MSASHSVDDNRLGLTAAELQILRQQQQIAVLQVANRDAAATRGRGTSRHSQTSSRAVSAASSQGGHGRLLLDPRTLQALYGNLDNLMRSIRGRIDDLDDATQRSVQASQDRARQTEEEADEQLRRMRRIMADMDRLDAECDRIQNIRDAVKRMKARIDAAGDRLVVSQPSSGRDHGHGGGHSGRHPSDRHVRHELPLRHR